MASIIEHVTHKFKHQSSNNGQTSEEPVMMSLKGKIAVVTGGSKGIGKATSLALARAGATVVLNYGSDASSAEATVKEIGSDNAFAVQADVSKMSGVEHLVRATVEKYKKIDILIPNAGIMPMKTLEQTTEADFDQTYAMNVKGPYFLAQKAVPYMGEGSHIVFLSTTLTAASTVTPNYLLYCSTKGAIEQMTKIISKEIAGKGISVNAVSPGPTGTDLFYKGKSEEMLKMIAGFNPHKRIGEPEEIADSIVFLSSPASRWVTGQVLRVNGGMA